MDETIMQEDDGFPLEQIYAGKLMLVESDPWHLDDEGPTANLPWRETTIWLSFEGALVRLR